MLDQAALTRRLERLVDGAMGFAAEPHLDAVLHQIADLARDVADARYAAIGMLAPDRRTLELFVTSGLTPEEIARIGALPTGRGVLGTVTRSDRPIRVTDIAVHPDSVGFPAGHPPMRTFLGVPVTGRTGTLGNLYLTEKAGGGPFTDDDEDLVRLLAGMAASAIENARHHETTNRLLADVQALLRSRERFFAMVNHELRNAISAVYGWAELLTRRKAPGELPQAAFEVLESAESAVSLINDLLDLSRLDEDRLRPVPRDLDLVGVLASAIGKLTPTARSKDVVVVLEAPPEGLLCRTDGHRVEQIMVNLLSNAVRHTGQGTRVTVLASRGSGGLDVTVTDEGEGIPPEHLERIFEVYTSRPGGQGLGLGLPLSLRLARLLGGTLTAGNLEPPGRGARLTLWLPVETAATPAEMVVRDG